MKLSKEDLHERYWVNGQSCVDIGAEVGKDPKTIHAWMKSYGMQTRGRGQDPRQHFKKGHKLCVGRVPSEGMREKLRAARVADGSKGLFKENGDHVLKGRKGAEIHSWKGGITPERQAFVTTEEWKAAVAELRIRANDTCERCGKIFGGEPKSFHAHHVMSFRDFPSLRADVSNLKWLCAPCHRWVHSASNIENIFIGAEHEKA